jgi:hypothetical protein
VLASGMIIIISSILLNMYFDYKDGEGIDIFSITALGILICALVYYIKQA